MHAQLVQIRNKIQKEQKPPAHSITKGVGRPPKPPLQQTLGPVPTFTPFEGPAYPISESKQGHLFLVLQCESQ